MIYKEEIAETEVMLNSSYDWENQLKELKESFYDFYLLKYELKDINGLKYNCFKFTHKVQIIDNTQ
jgi:hypothetical protein